MVYGTGGVSNELFQNFESEESNKCHLAKSFRNLENGYTS